MFILPKLKLEHVELTSYSRMRVDLAAEVIQCYLQVYASEHLQILSSSVANGLEHCQILGSEETAKFVRMFDRVFDCLNARSRKADKADRQDTRVLMTTD